MLQTIRRVVDLYSSYGMGGLARLSLDILWTKFSLTGARILRRPFYLRGKRWITVGKGFTAGPGLRIEALPIGLSSAAIIVIGEGVQVNDYVHIAGVRSLTIGNRVLIASKVFISDHGHGCYKTGNEGDSPLVPPSARQISCAPVVIEDDVWIGEFVSVLPGVTIGKGSVIGTMSTVTRNIPPFCIAVGSPARVIKKYDFETSTWYSV